MSERDALIARMQEARQHQVVRLHYRATYTGRNAQSTDAMLEAIIHRRGNRRDYGYSRHWGHVTVSRFGVGSWEVLRDRVYPPRLEIFFAARPDRVDRRACAIQTWLGKHWQLGQITQERSNRELAEYYAEQRSERGE